jgi:hypothetical protein
VDAPRSCPVTNTAGHKLLNNIWPTSIATFGRKGRTKACTLKDHYCANIEIKVMAFFPTTARKFAEEVSIPRYDFRCRTTLHLAARVLAEQGKPSLEPADEQKFRTFLQPKSSRHFTSS